MSASREAYDSDGAGTRTLELLEGAERYNRWLFSWLRPQLGAINCELGAGHGTLTRLALEQHQVLATEPSSVGRGELLRRFAEHPRFLGAEPDLFALDDTRTFDCVYSANVLEHIADDVQVLARASQLLKPGGRFVAVVPALSCLYSRFDALIGHRRRYGHADRVRLETALERERIPLALTKFSYKNPVGGVGWFFQMRLLRRSTLGTEQVALAERLVPWLEKLDRFELPFGQSLVLGLVRR